MCQVTLGLKRRWEFRSACVFRRCCAAGHLHRGCAQHFGAALEPNTEPWAALSYLPTLALISWGNGTSVLLGIVVSVPAAPHHYGCVEWAEAQHRLSSLRVRCQVSPRRAEPGRLDEPTNGGVRVKAPPVWKDGAQLLFIRRGWRWSESAAAAGDEPAKTRCAAWVTQHLRAVEPRSHTRTLGVQCFF